MYIVLCGNSINKKKVETALVVCGGVFFSNTGNKMYNKVSVKGLDKVKVPKAEIQDLTMDFNNASLDVHPFNNGKYIL